jgi:hypothetical protein
MQHTLLVHPPKHKQHAQRNTSKDGKVLVPLVTHHLRGTPCNAKHCMMCSGPTACMQGAQLRKTMSVGDVLSMHIKAGFAQHAQQRRQAHTTLNLSLTDAMKPLLFVM